MDHFGGPPIPHVSVRRLIWFCILRRRIPNFDHGIAAAVAYQAPAVVSEVETNDPIAVATECGGFLVRRQVPEFNRLVVATTRQAFSVGLTARLETAWPCP